VAWNDTVGWGKPGKSGQHGFGIDNNRDQFPFG